jgi:hypothetical protein
MHIHIIIIAKKKVKFNNNKIIINDCEDIVNTVSALNMTSCVIDISAANIVLTQTINAFIILIVKW